MMTEVFLLTKAPGSARSELCLKMVEASDDPRLYLAGDGVYHLLCDLPSGKVTACKEDILARGIPNPGRASVPEDFYSHLLEEVMEKASRAYSF
jgi:tRNA 2-thiouridine synthesizing protein B